MTDLLPPHDDIALALEDLGAALGASGLHGLLTGLACTGTAVLPEVKLRALLIAELDVDEGALDDASFRALQQLDQIMRRQLADDEFGFELLLPEDDLLLAERVRAMAEWCAGFLGGFGVGAGGRRDGDLSADVRTLLRNISEFTRAEAGGDEAASVDAAEKDFAELVEYLRIAALTIFLELARPRDGGRTPSSPVH